MKKGIRSIVVVAGVVTLGAIPVLAGTAGAKTAAKGKADSGTSYISVEYQKGGKIYASGYSFDKLFGQSAATFVSKVTAGTVGTVNVTAKPVTLYTAKGSLSGTGSAVENLATNAVSNGKLNLTHGTGDLKGHTFKGTFTGTYDSTTKVYTYTYKGTYK